MNKISDCCSASLERITREPKDPEYRHMSEHATICSQCREDCQEIPACDMCGEPGDIQRFDGNDYCTNCREELRKLNPGLAI